jgi:LmbE family N-acetylglucosaminyl deacetylase
MINLEIEHEVINKRKLALPQVVVVGAHTDDDAMFNLTTDLGKRGYGVTIATLTNSDNRKLPGIEPEELIDIRWTEAINSGRRAGITQVLRARNIGDGRLLHNHQEGIAFLSEIVLSNDVMAVVTPNESDPHIDHLHAAILGEKIAGNSTPLYQTDTISGKGRNNELLTPSFYVPISHRTAHEENLIYLENTSQVTNLPAKEMRDVAMVLDMTRRSGKKIGVPRAAAIYDMRNARTSPFVEIFTNKIAA